MLTQNRQNNSSRKLPKSLENYRNSIFLSLLSLSRFKLILKCSGCVEKRGGRGLFIGISNQSETSRVAARVSLRMAPDACAAAPRAPLVFQHGLLTCKVTPRLLPVWMHGLAPCKETPRPPHVWPHGLVACIVTPRAWPIHLVLHMSTCMYRFHVLQHLMLSLTHILPGACHHVLNTHTSSHLELLGQLSDICLPVNFRPAINPKYFSTTVLMI